MADVTATAPPAISEAAFTANVIALARMHGWLAYHALPARTNKGWRTLTMGNVGFPDLVLARPGGLIFAELKTERGVLSPSQFQWTEALVDALAGHGETLRYEVWRPSQLQEIEELLR